MRKIVVDGIEWRYHVGRSFVVAVRVADNLKRSVSFPKLTGLTWDEVDRGIRKRWLSITPQLIYNWLSGKDLQC